MSLTVSCVQLAEVSGPDTEGRYLAQYDKGRDRLIITAGGAAGPMLAMSKADWGRINDEVRRAFMRADNYCGYTACEGHNGDDD